MVKSGRVVWGICFVLLLLSSPLLVSELLVIQRAIEQTSGADFWYEGQLKRELLRLKVVLIEAKLSRSEAAVAAIRRHLDLAFSRLNTLPRTKSNDWHTQGIADLPEVELVRAEVEAVDAEMPLLETRPAAFLDDAVRRIDVALEHSQTISLKVVDRQNALIGQMQTRFHWFRIKLLFYGAGFVALILGLGYLMYRHARSEAGLRAAYHRVAELAGVLTEARDDAIRANRAKSNFLANVSHELRTPLNAIIGFSEMLGGGYCGPLTDKQGEYVGDVHVAAQRLLALINDILDLSKLEAGKHELTEEVIDLAEIVRRSAHDMREEIRKAGLTAEVDVATAPPAVLGDAPKLRQVVDNLLANAIKFTEGGGAIRLNVSQCGDGGVELAVADTGIGIAEDDIPKIFKPFEQIDSDRARLHKGTGLGLPLVKGLVELHNGTVAVNSTPGAGTVVTVKLPPDRVLPAARGRAPGGDAGDAAARTRWGGADAGRSARPRAASDYR